MLLCPASRHANADVSSRTECSVHALLLNRLLQKHVGSNQSVVNRVIGPNNSLWKQAYVHCRRASQALTCSKTSQVMALPGAIVRIRAVSPAPKPLTPATPVVRMSGPSMVTRRTRLNEVSFIALTLCVEQLSSQSHRRCVCALPCCRQHLRIRTQFRHCVCRSACAVSAFTPAVFPKAVVLAPSPASGS